MTAWLVAIGGILVGSVVGALLIITALISQFTGWTWREVWSRKGTWRR